MAGPPQSVTSTLPRLDLRSGGGAGSRAGGGRAVSAGDLPGVGGAAVPGFRLQRVAVIGCSPSSPGQDGGGQLRGEI